MGKPSPRAAQYLPKYSLPRLIASSLAGSKILNNVMPDIVKNNDKLSFLYQIFVEKPFIIGFIFAYFVYSDLKDFTNSSLQQQAQTIAELQNLNQQAIKRNEELSADFKLYMEENSKILREITLRLENLEKRLPEK